MKYLLKVSIFVWVFSFQTEFIHACSCLKPRTAQEGLEGADAVFLGIPVISQLKEIDVTEIGGRKVAHSIIETKFRVLKTWKGISNGYVWVSTAAEGGTCGYAFWIARTYLVYADGKGQLSTSSCHRTAHEAEASRDLKDLGPPSREFQHQPGEKF